MKKTLLMFFAAAGMLAACTNSHEPLMEQGDGEQVITLKVSSAGDGLTTRVGRDLYSSEAGQEINNVKLIIVDAQNTVVSQTTIGNWGDVSNAITGGGSGREMNVRLQGSDKVATQGSYKIYAYGYTTGTEYEELSTAIGQVANGSVFAESQILTFKPGTDSAAKGKLAEEIFAGEGTLEVDEFKSATGSVTLHRQVAGTFGYFKNIPYEAGATKLVLKASANVNTQLVLGNFVNGENNVTNVVNGTEGGTSNVIYTINLKDWFGETLVVGEDGKTISITNWKNPYGDATATFAAGSVFGGTFMIPMSAVGGVNTFVLELQKEDGTVSRTWNIKLPADDNQLKATSITKWDASASAFTSATMSETVSSYSILRNHLYSVGTRNSKNPTNPGDGTLDAPQDLSKDQTLTLQVNDNWEAIHNMEID